MSRNYNPRNAAAAVSIVLTMAFALAVGGIAGYNTGQKSGFEKGYNAATNENRPIAPEAQ